MGKVDEHRAALRARREWLPYLAERSGLPGPRANLELVAACGEEAGAARVEELLAAGDEFATMCGLVAAGRLLGEADTPAGWADVLHRHATDPSWRVREAVAMGLQRAAADDPGRAFALAEAWSRDPDPLVRRAAVAAVCEPPLLGDQDLARRALALADAVTAGLTEVPAGERRSDGVRVLRKALGYGWSVVVAALPDEGLPVFRRWEASDDPDVAWVVRENRKKVRLSRLLQPTEPAERA